MRRTITFAIAVLAASVGCAQAQYPDHSKDAYWKQLVDEAIADKFQWDRGCYPNEQGVQPYCSLSLVSPVQNGKQMRLMEFSDTNNNLLSRSICVSNTVQLTRSCYDVETSEATDQMFDSKSEQWTVLRTRKGESFNDALTELSPPTTQQPQASYRAFKEWDQQTGNGTTIHRQLSYGTDGSMQLNASEHDTSGNIVTSSICHFNQSRSDCVNQVGQHYQLKPNSITYFYSLMRP
jgi:hypothetical protein